MRPGGGKAKGAEFEREICVMLSQWVTKGKREDLFWRSAMSGGRATVAKRRGSNLASQAGDISAVHRLGHVLTADFYFELKHVKDLGLTSFIVKSQGPLAKFWKTACKEARVYKKEPILIVRQNRLPALVVAKVGTVNMLHVDRMGKGLAIVNNTVPHRFRHCEIWLLDDVLNAPFKYATPIEH